MQGVFFDANGVMYYRQNHRQRMLAFLERYHVAGLPRSDVRGQLAELREQVSRGQVSQETFYNAVLDRYGLAVAGGQKTTLKLLASV